MEKTEIRFARKKIERRQRRKRALVKVLMILLLPLIAWSLYPPVKTMITSKLVTYETVKWGTLEHCVEAQALIIRREHVLTAPANGTFMPTVAEGEKVPVGKVIGYVQTQASTTSKDQVKVAVKSPKAGIVCYRTDGLEGMLTPNMLDKLDIEKVSMVFAENVQAVEPVVNVESGKPILKLVDNLRDAYLYIKVQKAEDFEAPTKDSIITLKLPKGEKKFAKITDIKERETELHLIAQINGLIEEYLNTRKISIELVPMSYEGIVLPKRALVFRETEPGIFYSYKGSVKWSKVEIVGTLGEEVAVRGLKVGSQYIVNPHLVFEGQQLY